MPEVSICADTHARARAHTHTHPHNYTPTHRHPPNPTQCTTHLTYVSCSPPRHRLVYFCVSPACVPAPLPLHDALPISATSYALVAANASSFVGNYAQCEYLC